MSYFSSSLSSSRKRKATTGDWEKLALTVSSAKSRIGYVDACVKCILQKSKANEDTMVFYSPFRPCQPTTQAVTCKKAKSTAVVTADVSGTQKDFFPNHEQVAITCTVCRKAISFGTFSRCKTLKNAFVEPSWSLLCPTCAKTCPK